MNESTNGKMDPTAIYDHFRGLIITGRLGRGEQLPTVRQTAHDLGVTYDTAAQAYNRLEQLGLIVTTTGTNVEVSEHASPLPASVVGLVRALAQLTTQTRTDPNDVLASLLAELR